MNAALQVSLFANCVIPGCPNPVAEVGTPCRDCLTAFGPMLRRNTAAPRLTAEQIAGRDEYVARAYANQRALTQAGHPNG